MMKNLIRSVIFAITFILLTSVVAKADSDISLKRIYTSADSVEVSIDNVNTIVSSFQLSLKLEGSVKLKDIVWSKELNKNAKTNFKYNSNDNILDIYVTSKENLVNKSGKIAIGTLKVYGPKKGQFNIVPNLEKDTGVLKLVSNKHKEKVISNMTIEGDDEFVLPGDNPSVDLPEDNTSKEEDKPSMSSKPGGNQNTSTSNKAETNISLTNKKPSTSRKPENNISGSLTLNNKVEANNNLFHNEQYLSNESTEFKDVENEILSGDNEKHISQVEDETNMGKKEVKSSKFNIYIAGVIIAVLISSAVVIYKKVK